MISIISTHRNRPESLKCFIKSLELNNIKFDYEIIITDLNSNFDVMKYDNKHLNLKFECIKYDGPFWKTKALNYAVSKSKYNIITVVDIDSVFMPGFFNRLKQHISKKSSSFKLAHRVKFLRNNSTNLLNNIDSYKDVELSAFLNNVSRKCEIARERYSDKGIVINGFIPNIYHNQVLGNSHYTMRKVDFLSIGGYDERFIGHGLEDMDFNLRAYSFLKTGTLMTGNDNVIFNMSHSYSSDWRSESLRENNRQIYRSNKGKGVVILDRSKDWGIFNIQ